MGSASNSCGMISILVKRCGVSSKASVTLQDYLFNGVGGPWTHPADLAFTKVPMVTTAETHKDNQQTSSRIGTSTNSPHEPCSHHPITHSLIPLACFVQSQHSHKRYRLRTNKRFSLRVTRTSMTRNSQPTLHRPSK